jgi:hypothetical protein
MLFEAGVRGGASWLCLASKRHRESALCDFIEVPQDPTGDTERIADVEQTLDLLAAKLMPAELAPYLLRKA